ncbi:MAG TPA: magnesium transporter [Alphaproteobacteria bacterium]|nr:magnesium transporter [Alphaproteobacteria bacterium]
MPVTAKPTQKPVRKEKKPALKPDEMGRITPLGLSDELYVKVLDALEHDPKPQRAVLEALLEDIHPADIANLLERLPRDRRAELLPFLPEEKVGSIISELEPGVQEHVLHLLRPEDVKEAIEELPSDDAADVARAAADSSGETSPRLDAETMLADYQQKRLLNYDPHTAGGLMQLEVVTAPRTQTVEQTLKYIRDNSDDMPMQPGTIFVVNAQRKLLGTVSISRLIQVPLELKLGDVMRPDPLSAKPDMPKAEVVSMFEKYDMHNLAVINRRGQLLGRIAIDDVLDVVLAEATDTQARSVGLDADEDLFAPVLTTTRHRLLWLIINLGTAIAAAAVIALFEDSIAKLTLLAVLMPIVASMGGNATTQTQTVIIRGMALGQVTRQNRLALLTREFLANLNVSMILAATLGIGVAVLYGQPKLAVVIALATICNHIIAAMGGWVTPIVLKRFGYDPAIAASVITTTFTDVGGFFCFLGLATWLLL